MKRLKLRRADACALCHAALDVGVEAVWDNEARTVTCLACHDDPTRAVLSGTAGASALAMGERLHDAQMERRRQLKEHRPILGRLEIAIAGPVTAGDEWVKGAIGEQKLGAFLDRMRDAGVLTLHDRKLPRSQANIDHLLIAAGGVWIVDAKRYAGVVRKVDTGGWFSTDLHLTVGGRDRTKLVDGVRKQVGHVSRALDSTAHASAPVHGALCFVDTEWALFTKPFEIDGVVITWPKALQERVLMPGPLDQSERLEIQRHLAESFGPAT